MKKVFILLAVTLLTANVTLATRYWPTQVLTNWEITINNGVVYVNSSQMASHCTYSRAQINLDGTELNKAQYAFILSAKARNKSLRYVIDSDDTVCVISGLKEL